MPNVRSNVPYLALGYELAGESFARTKLFAIERCIECVGYIIAAGGPAVIMAFSSVRGARGRCVVGLQLWPNRGL